MTFDHTCRVVADAPPPAVLASWLVPRTPLCSYLLLVRRLALGGVLSSSNQAPGEVGPRERAGHRDR